MPLNISGSSTGSESILLKWDSLVPEEQNGMIHYYIVSVIEVYTGVVKNHTAYSEEIHIFSLHPYYIYHIYVAAVTVGQGPFSDRIVVQTEEDGK